MVPATSSGLAPITSASAASAASSESNGPTTGTPTTALVQGAGEQHRAVAFEQPVADKRYHGTFYEGATRVQET